MQSVANEAPEKEAVATGNVGGTGESTAWRNGRVGSNAVGVNNHQGSQATSDPALMNELMPALRGFNLFYVDSRTTAATWRSIRRQRDGVPRHFEMFRSLMTCRTPLRFENNFNSRARREREEAAIAIGHPHAATLEALREFLPTVRASGVRSCSPPISCTKADGLQDSGCGFLPAGNKK